MNRFFVWCSGANRNVLARPECATVRDRYAALGAKVLFVAAFAGLAMGYLLREVFGPVVAMPLGTLWSAVIFNLDRFLLGTLVQNDHETLVRFGLRALPRLAVALLIAGAVSEPLLVAVFRQEIALQMEKDDLGEREAAVDRLRRRQAFDRERLDEEEREVQRRLAHLDALVAGAYEAAAAEADGLAGSKIRGRGPRWTEKMERYQLLLAEYRELQQRSAQDLRRIRDRRTELARQEEAEIRRLSEQAAGARGFLRAQMALERLRNDPEVGWVVTLRVWLIRLLIFALEILPLLSKLLLPRSPYDALFQHLHDTQVRLLDSRRTSSLSELDAQDRLQEEVRKTATSTIIDDLKSPGVLAETAPELAQHLADVRLRFVRGVSGWAAASGTSLHEPTPPAPREAPGRADHVSRAVARAAQAVWRSPAPRIMGIIVVVGLVPLLAVGVVAFPYVARPCGTGPCPVDEWVDAARSQTVITDATGTPFATYPGFPHVTAASLPRYVVPLVVAVEDKRFFSHFGVDLLAASSALVSNILGRPRRGASTITMQAVRGIDRRSLMQPSGTWPGKLAEARAAFDLERRYGKDEILDLYLNTVDLGWISGVHILGINHAAWTYFGKPASHLTLAEAATLVGMIKGPQLYHPISRPDNSRVRRDAVLHRLATVRPEYVDDAATALGEALATIPLDRIPKPPAVVSLIGRRISGVTPPSVVRSTLDGDLQRAVEGELEALIRDIESGSHGSYGVDPQNSLIGGAIVMDAPTGSVRAYVCGRAMGLTAGWDPCSAGRVSLSSVSKVFLLLTALDLGIVRTGDTLEDVKGRATAGSGSPYLDQICAGRGLRNRWPLERLVAVSDNCFAVALHRLLPPQAFAQLREIGISVDPTQPASALGTGTISLLELTRLMAGLANGGIVPPWQVLESDRAESPVAASDRLPFRATTLSTGRKILAGVLQHGTAAGARPMLPPDLPAFAKTGTDGSNQELLIAGAAGTLVTTLWIGHQSTRRPITEAVTAGAVLGPHWGRIVAAALETNTRSGIRRLQAPSLRAGASRPGVSRSGGGRGGRRRRRSGGSARSRRRDRPGACATRGNRGR